MAAFERLHGNPADVSERTLAGDTGAQVPQACDGRRGRRQTLAVERPLLVPRASHGGRLKPYKQ